MVEKRASVASGPTLTELLELVEAAILAFGTGEAISPGLGCRRSRRRFGPPLTRKSDEFVIRSLSRGEGQVSVG